MSYNESLTDNSNSLESEVDEPTPQYIIPPEELNAYADRWHDILSNPPPPTKPTRPSAPAPTPASGDVELLAPAQQQIESTSSVGGSKPRTKKDKASLSTSTLFYRPHFDDKELDYRLHCLAREKRLLYGANPEDHELISKFDVFEEFQSYFLPDDNYICQWNGNRRASSLCDQVTWGRLDGCPIRGTITDPQYLSFSASAMNFGEGVSPLALGRADSRSNHGLYLSRRHPSEAYRPPTTSTSLSFSERSTPTSSSI